MARNGNITEKYAVIVKGAAFRYADADGIIHFRVLYVATDTP